MAAKAARPRRVRVAENIYKRGDAYEVRVRPFRPVYVRTLEAARKVRTNLLNQRGAGDVFDEPPITLGEALAGTLERAKTLKPIADGTVTFNERSAVFWQPFENRLLTHLHRAELEDVLVARAKLHPTSARNERQLLMRSLREAKDRGQRFDQQILKIPPIEVQAREGRALTREQHLDLVSWTREYAADLVELAGGVGNRINELFTLTDDRVNIFAGTLFIPKRLNKEKRDKLIPLCQHEVAIVRRRLANRPKAAGSLVFSKREGGQWNRHHWRSKVWLPALEAASKDAKRRGVVDPFMFDLDGQPDELHTHDLRHTAVTLCAAAGMRVEYVAERVGHGDGGKLILDTYRHLFRDERVEQMRLLDRFYNPPVEDETEAKEEAE